MASFLTAAAAVAGSSSVGGALVRILIAYGISRLINKATGSENNSPSQIDQGIRLQVAPDTTNAIPVLYGSAYLGGRITDAQLVDANQTMWYCLTIAETPTTTTTRLSDGATITTTFDEIYWNNQRVYFKADGVTIDYLVNQDGIVDTSPRDLVKIYLYNGSSGPTRPTDLLEYLPTLPTLHGDARTLMPEWTSDERMVGLSFALVKISYNRDKGITGLPDLQFKVSNNLFRPGDAIHAFLRNKISGANLPSGQIDTASLIALNDYADDTVNYFDEDDGVTKTLANRYQINGVLNPNESVMTNLQKLAGNAGCFVNYDIATGLWGVTLNKEESAVLHFDDSNIISGIDLTGTNLDNMYNAVEVEFPHRELRDQFDTIRINLPTEYRNANEPDNLLKLRLDMINEPLQARELGYLELYQNRMDQVVTFTTDYSKINTEAGDVITVSSSVYGWSQKPYRVVRVREVESDQGGLAVEITAQEYDATMYTAGGLPRRPRVPSVPIGIPDITVIGTPSAPTVTEINRVAVPALDITGLTPSGIVDRFEYWYSNDNGATYKILGSRSNSNGSPYAQGTSLTFRAASLPAGSYLFKVRGGNEKAFGDFSPASTPKVWEPVQVTDVVNENTKVETPGLGDLLPVLGIGALAYFAYKAFAPEALKALSKTDLGKLLGIADPDEIEAAQQALEQQAAAFRIVNAGNISFSAGVDDTLTLLAGAGIEITGDDFGHTITITATGEVEGAGFIKATAGGEELLASTDNNLKFVAGAGITIEGDPTTSTVTITADSSSTGEVDSIGVVDGTTDLPGSIFPTIYKTDSVPTHNAIFTHGNLVYASSSYNGKIKNVVSLDSYLYPSRTNIDNANRYYSYCDYDPSKELCEQNWGPWRLWKDPESQIQPVPVSGPTTNPPLAGVYSVDGEFECGGNTLKTTGSSDTYDYFVPDVQPTQDKEVIKNYQLLQVYRGKLLVFGASNHNFPDNTSFRENTIFGEQTADLVKSGAYTVTGPDVATITPLSTGSSLFVASKRGEVDSLWYSTDTNLVNWTKVSKVTFEGTAATDGQTKSKFNAIGAGPVGGATKFLAVKNQSPSRNEIASSTDGINWIEHGKEMPSSRYPISYSDSSGYVYGNTDVNEIVRNGSNWLSDNLAKSTNGLDWTFMTGAGERNLTFDGGASGRCVKVIPGYNGEFVIVFRGLTNWLAAGQPIAQEPHIKTISSINADVNGLENISYQQISNGMPSGGTTYYIMISAAVAGSKYYYYGWRSVFTGVYTPRINRFFLRIVDRAANTTTEIPFAEYSGGQIDTGYGWPVLPYSRTSRNYNDMLYYNDVTNKLILVVGSVYKEIDLNASLVNGEIPASALKNITTRSNHRGFKNITSTKVAVISTTGVVVYNKSDFVSGTTVTPTTINTVGTITGEPIAYRTEYCFPGAVGANPRINRVGDYGIGNIPPVCVNYKIIISSSQISTIP